MGARNLTHEAYRHRLRKGGGESSGHNESERIGGLVTLNRRPSPPVLGEGSMEGRNLIDTIYPLRRGGSDGTMTRTHRATGEALLAPTRNRRSKVGPITGSTGKWAERREGGGRACSSREANVMFVERRRLTVGRSTNLRRGKGAQRKAPVGMQDPRRGTYRTAKTSRGRNRWSSPLQHALYASLGCIRAEGTGESAADSSGPQTVRRSQQESPVREIRTPWFDVAGPGNVVTAAGLRPGAKATDKPPEPKGWRARPRPYARSGGV